jgi:FtsZ-binding cell division protein ZapB
MHEDDPLAGLEERIRRTADLVASLKAERDAAVADRDSAREAASAAITELEGLRSERTQVRTRIQKLLGQMDLL